MFVFPDWENSPLCSEYHCYCCFLMLVTHRANSWMHTIAHFLRVVKRHSGKCKKSLTKAETCLSERGNSMEVKCGTANTSMYGIYWDTQETASVCEWSIERWNLRWGWNSSTGHILLHLDNSSDTLKYKPRKESNTVEQTQVIATDFK